jgi:methionine-rich copper-binding protein CopC
MSIKPGFISALFALLAIGFSGTAIARTTLLSTTPAAEASASGVRSLTLTFSDRVAENSAGVEIVMTAMPGMSNHQAMKIVGFKSAMAADGKAMSITLPRALPAGTYKVSWHAVASDGQPLKGQYAFSVK